MIEALSAIFYIIIMTISVYKMIIWYKKYSGECDGGLSFYFWFIVLIVCWIPFNSLVFGVL